MVKYTTNTSRKWINSTLVKNSVGFKNHDFFRTRNISNKSVNLTVTQHCFNLPFPILGQSLAEKVTISKWFNPNPKHMDVFHPPTILWNKCWNWWFHIGFQVTNLVNLGSVSHLQNWEVAHISTNQWLTLVARLQIASWISLGPKYWKNVWQIDRQIWAFPPSEYSYLFDFCLMCMCFLMCMDMRVQPMDSSTWLSLLADWRFAWSDRKFAVYILTSIPKYVIYCILYSAEHSRKGMYKLPWGFLCGTISWGLGLTCLWKRCHCSRLVVYPVVCNLLHVPGAAVHQFVHELHGPRCVVGRDVFHSSTSLKNTMCVSTIGTTWTPQCIIFRLKTGGPKATLFVGKSYFVCGHHVNQKHSWLWCFATLFVQRCWLLLGARLKSLVGSQLPSGYATSIAEPFCWSRDGRWHLCDQVFLGRVLG